MASSIKWFTDGLGGRYTENNHPVVLTREGADALATESLTPNLEEIIYGEYTKWISNLIFFPIDFSTGAKKKLTCGMVDTDVPCYSIDWLAAEDGFTLGEYHYTGRYGDFRDYEPYTTVQIYLPFYGYVSVPVADIMDMYVQFRLKVDVTTGQALYTIGVNRDSVTSPNPPYWIGTDDTYTIIIGQYSFNIGTAIPVGRTGMVDTIRNITMGVVKGAAIAAGAYAVALGGGTGGTSKVRTVATTRNPKTGRQVTEWTYNKDKEYDNRAYHKGRAVTTAFDVGASTLSNMSITPSTDISNNVFVNDNCPWNVYIVRRRSMVEEATAEYKALYGTPLGDVRRLSTIHGYTEVSAIHFEGNGFGTATNKEMAMIEEAFSDGVILP